MLRKRISWGARGGLAVALAVGATVIVSPSPGGDADLLAALRGPLVRAEAAEQAASRGAAGPELVQQQYNAARDLIEALRAAEPVSTSCRPLLDAARAYGDAQVLAVEGYDRPWPPLADLASRRSERATAQITARQSHCRPTRVKPAAIPREPISPKSDEAFFGLVTSPTPPGTAIALIAIGGRSYKINVFRNQLTWRIPPDVPPGRYDVRLAFSVDPAACTSDCIRGRAIARRVWLLPATARTAKPERSPDRTLSARLAALGRTLPGYTAIRTHDLASGRTGAWNAEAHFPAASTVKLAVLIAALHRFGPRPERSRAGYDLRALTGWSSNAASNRLLLLLGGSEAEGSRIAEQVLQRLGATSSTFTGFYRLGTRARPSSDRSEPPRVSSRVTTAHDLARILLLLQRGSLGESAALRQLGLTRHEARVGLGMLLSWSAPAPGDNIGNLAPALPGKTPVAQKNGWFSAVRHTAAIVYGPSGPKIIVLLTYQPNERLATAQSLGAKLVATVGGGR